VLNALGTAATAMRGKLGESLNSIQKLNRPLEQATTPSLEALQNYSAGISEINQGHFLPAVQLFERAIAIDPNFAMAYYNLGVAFYVAGDIPSAQKYVKQAFRMIDRVSEYERDQIATTYYKATGEADKAIDAYQLGIRDFPRDWYLYNNLGNSTSISGNTKRGLRRACKRLDCSPMSSLPTGANWTPISAWTAFQRPNS
jgi:tetratricopeptide (TPR) repeat protein